ncbi:unnamed protein product [Amoebophrya sp. A120]|nr:unnamed protein product [Amoebophrya sp. A120]|eukprot:GSA120T00005293001.1
MAAEIDLVCGESMTAVVCYGPRDYRLEIVPKPTLQDPGEVLLRVLAVGICAGDSKCYAGADHFWKPGEYGESYCQPPVIPGHEFVGEVVEIQEGDRGTTQETDKTSLNNKPWTIGDWVTVEQLVPCTSCRYCKRGHYNMCMPHDIFGFRQKAFGAMAEFVKIPKNALIHGPLSKQTLPQHLAFCEPLACAVHAANRADVGFDDVVVVSGCGPIGLGALAACRRKNPKTLIALDRFPRKLEVAKKCGADVVINVAEEDAIAIVKSLTEGYGCDKYIEAAGHPGSVVQGLQMIARKGVFVEYAVFGTQVTADWTVISDAKEIEIRGGHLSPNTFAPAIRLLQEMPLADIVTHVLPFTQFQEGFRLVDASSESIKVVLVPPSNPAGDSAV